MALEADVKAAFSPLSPQILGVFVWGSHARGEATPRSDVDVCVVAGPDGDIVEAVRAGWRAAASVPHLRVDVHAFEELPLVLQGAVLEEGIVVAAQDAVKFGDYLRPFYKAWADQRHRAAATPEAITRSLERLAHGRA